MDLNKYLLTYLCYIFFVSFHYTVGIKYILDESGGIKLCLLKKFIHNISQHHVPLLYPSMPERYALPYLSELAPGRISAL